MRVLGFVKVRNEIIREGNLYRMLEQMGRICDGGIICDDASTDGTTEEIERWLRTVKGMHWDALFIERGAQNFRKEMHVKQQMLDMVHALSEKPDWILWQDGDELFDEADLEGFRYWLKSGAQLADVWAFHYTQFWRSPLYARTDNGFDHGWFWKLWRYRPDLAFECANELHSYQFPKNYLEPIMEAVRKGGSHGKARRAPQEIFHAGNVGKNLVWKCVQYRNSGPLQDASMDRHLHFTSQAEYRRISDERIPSSVSPMHTRDVHPHTTLRDPRIVNNTRHGASLVREAMVFTNQEQQIIERMGDLKDRPGLCTIIIPTYNRGSLLRRTIKSVLDQTYQNWVCVVLDDGSTDNTPQLMGEVQESDPRIFYCRYEENRGGVAMNEIGMALSCEFGEFWVRLGSDDYFKPHKLELDVAAFKAMPECGAAWGPYRDLHGTQERDLRGIPQNANADARGSLLSHGFAASWANIAVRTSVLRQVRDRHGRFCEPTIRNMEDYLVNVRIAYLTEFVWRARLKDGRTVFAKILGDSWKLIMPAIESFENIMHDAVWHIGADGASQNSAQCGIDAQITLEVLRTGMPAFTPTPREDPVLKVLPT